MTQPAFFRIIAAGLWAAVCSVVACQPQEQPESQAPDEPSAIASDAAPEAIGPYSQAIRAGDMVFLSGQIPMDPQSGDIVGETMAEQTRQVLDNLQAVLHEAGLDFDQVVKTNVYLDDMDAFEEMNAVYAEAFSPPEPARETVQVSRLPGDVKVEISAIAVSNHSTHDQTE